MDLYKNSSAFMNYPNTTTDSSNTTSRSDVSTDNEEPYASIVKGLHRSSIVIVLLSLIGNTLIIIVMSRKANSKCSISVYLMALAVSDMLYMLNVPFHLWLDKEFNVNVYNARLPWLLTAKFVFNYTFKVTSALMLAGVTVVRVFSVALPLKANYICTKTTATVSVVAITSFVVILYSCVFTFIVRFEFLPGSSLFTFVQKVDDGFLIFKLLDLIVGFLLPLTVISMGSIIITVNLHRRRNIQSSNTRNQSVTKILLAANVTFILTMSPATFTTLICEKNQMCGLTTVQYHVLFQCLLLIYDLNSTLNFYIYYLSGSKFRHDVKTMFTFCSTSSLTR